MGVDFVEVDAVSVDECGVKWEVVPRNFTPLRLNPPNFLEMPQGF